MKIGIISLMGGALWGGSEELWASTADHALRAGIEVSVYLQRPIAPHPKIDSLIHAGALVVGELPKDSFCYDVITRSQAISYRLSQYLTHILSPAKGFFSQRYDVILVNEGSAAPSAENIRMINEYYPNTPYVTLSHSTPPSIFDHATQVRAPIFFDGAYSSLFVSNASLAQTERVLCHRLGNSRVVRNPVNMPTIETVEWVDSATATMALVGELSVSRKGQDMLFEALSHEQWHERDYRLSVYGRGPDGTYLRDLARFYGIQNKINFEGHTSDVRSIWAKNQILIQPSRIESAPLSIVEAMLCGRCVVATAVGGVSEWISDGECGFLAKAPTTELILDALERAWQCRGKWQELGQRAQTTALALYDPTPGETLLSILKDAANNVPDHTNRSGTD